MKREPRIQWKLGHRDELPDLLELWFEIFQRVRGLLNNSRKPKQSAVSCDWLHTWHRLAPQTLWTAGCGWLAIQGASRTASRCQRNWTGSRGRKGRLLCGWSCKLNQQSKLCTALLPPPLCVCVCWLQNIGDFRAWESQSWWFFLSCMSLVCKPINLLPGFSWLWRLKMSVCSQPFCARVPTL